MRPSGRFTAARSVVGGWIVLLLATSRTTLLLQVVLVVHAADASAGRRHQHCSKQPAAVAAGRTSATASHHPPEQRTERRCRNRAVGRSQNGIWRRQREEAPPSLFAVAPAVMARGGSSSSPGGGASTTHTTATTAAAAAAAATTSPPEDNPPATATATADTPSSPRKKKSGSGSKLANFQQRLVPAVILLAGLYALVRRFRAPGLTVLLLLISPGLYHEAVSVVTQREPPAAIERAFQWWWFVAASLATTVPQALDVWTAAVPASSSSATAATATTAATYNWPHVAHLAAYSMMATGFMAWIYCLNAVPEAAVVHFQSAWNELAVYTMGVVFTVIPTAFWMAVLSSSADGMGWALYTALLVIVNDTMAYLFGFTVGQNPLLPTISPKKTWEGWLGAFASTVVLSVPIWKVFMKDTIYNRHALVIALFCCIVAPFGGFLASSVKRAGGKKDFGDLMPGHGGLVDRLDCQLLAAPFLFLYLRAFVLPSTPAP